MSLLKGNKREGEKVKSVRQAVIKNIIERQIIETQEDLAEALRQERIKVTQATVSRDIKEMMLIKVPTERRRADSRRYGRSSARATGTARTHGPWPLP